MEDEHPDAVLIQARNAINAVAAKLAELTVDPKSADDIVQAWRLVERVRQRESGRRSHWLSRCWPSLN